MDHHLWMMTEILLYSTVWNVQRRKKRDLIASLFDILDPPRLDTGRSSKWTYCTHIVVGGRFRFCIVGNNDFKKQLEPVERLR